MKKPYVKIEYSNCLLDWDTTICPFEMIADQILGVESDFCDIDEAGHEKCKPEIKMSVVFLTDKEWSKEFLKWDK